MTDLVRGDTENAGGDARGRRQLNKQSRPSSRCLAPSDRAPRLRRIAALASSQARRAESPEARVKLTRLARDLRNRATEIELFGYPADELDVTVTFMQAVSRIPV